MKHIFAVTFLVVWGLWSSISPAQDSIWDLQAVDENGLGTHPKVGADIGADPATSPNRVTIEGIALNSPAEILNASQMWQVYVQAEAPDQGGIAAWAGVFYNPDWPRYPMDIEPGDRIRVNGFVQNVRGKVNITERHSAAPGIQFVVTMLEKGVGMPDPIVIPGLAACNHFDQTRVSGGELYQAQWVQLNNVWIDSGVWGKGQQLILKDVTDATLTMLLSSEGDFDSYAEPIGSFSVVGIFDQEDLDEPFHDSYRLWVKKYSDITIDSSIQGWENY